MKRALADVLWEAANERLHTRDFPDYDLGVSRFTCDAVAMAIGGDFAGAFSFGPEYRSAFGFLERLGLPDCTARACFSKTSKTKRQGVRYMWLLLAMHVAEDEGIMLEVAR